MKYMVKVRDYYYFNRRVPEEMRELDKRGLVRVSLKTESRAEARRKAIILNDQVEQYWQSLVTTREPHSNASFRKAVRVARQLGFSYRPQSEIVNLPIMELLERILAIKDGTPKQIEAVLGVRKVEGIQASAALEKYWAMAKDQVMNKSPDQVRKWKNPRIKAVQNFIDVVGDKNLKAISRDDILAFKDWWIARIQADNKSPSSANKDFVHLKVVFATVSEHLKLGLDIAHLFGKIMFKNRFKKTRLPFTSEQIDTILNSPKLDNLNEDAKWFLFAASETGARPSEIVGLLPEDIKLNAEIPHICITDRKERPLKNANSARIIPLVGYSLLAFTKMPLGFPRYREKPDNLSGVVNKFLRENDLMPSKDYSVYSFRHSFQDRILSVNAPDRIQAELMGHKFNRPKYGDGGTLEHKKEWMYAICLRQQSVNGK